MTNEELVAEARRLENDYGDSYEVMTHMSALADALEASEARVKELEAKLAALQHSEDANGAIISVLNRLDELNNGGISYEVYSELHDLVSAIPAAVPDAATEGDYHEGLEEGIKIGRAECDAATEREIAIIEDHREKWMARAFRAEAERDAALAAVEVTRKLHHKITRYGNEDYSIEAEHFEEDPESYPDLRAFDLCAECYEVERLICEECGGDAPIGHRSNWPCPTVAALDGAPEPEEVEWEYRCDIRKHFWVTHGVHHDCEGRPERRRKAGPWLPVEGESK